MAGTVSREAGPRTAHMGMQGDPVVTQELLLPRQGTVFHLDVSEGGV